MEIFQFSLLRHTGLELAASNEKPPLACLVVGQKNRTKSKKED
jgi:hypothetical protein